MPFWLSTDDVLFFLEYDHNKSTSTQSINHEKWQDFFTIIGSYNIAKTYNYLPDKPPNLLCLPDKPPDLLLQHETIKVLL